MAMRHYQKARAGRRIIDCSFRHIGRLDFHVGGQVCRKHVVALVDPRHMARQRRQRAHDRGADMAGTEQHQMRAKRKTRIDQPAPVLSVANQMSGVCLIDCDLYIRASDTGTRDTSAVTVKQYCMCLTVERNHAPAVFATVPLLRQMCEVTARAVVDIFECQLHHAAATLAEARSQRKTLEPVANCRCSQHVARDFGGTPFQVAATDRVELRFLCDQHFRTRLAWRGAVDNGYRHQHRRIRLGGQCIEPGRHGAFRVTPQRFAPLRPHSGSLRWWPVH